jgi:hypothetical protein
MPAAVAETREEVAWLVGAIDHLPERQRSALLLRELAGLSHTEIAETLDTTTGSARQLITRARDGVREAAERDGRERETKKSRTLRRGLIEAVPMLPLASSAGFAVSAGSTAGGGFALGKIAATIFAAMVLAGGAGQISREVAEANESQGAEQPAASAQITGAAETRHSGPGTSGRSDNRSNASFGDIDAPDGKPGIAPKDSVPEEPSSNTGHEARSDATAKTDKAGDTDTPSEIESRVIEPVNQVVQLPGKVVEHVGGVLDGSSSAGEAVGNVVEDVVGTVGDVTSGLLTGSKSDSR